MLVGLERDVASRRISKETEVIERSKITTAVLDLLDELERREHELGLCFRVMPTGKMQLGISASVAAANDADLRFPTNTIDVFLSYARANRALVVELATMLQSRGCSAWFDHYIAGGTRFRDEIARNLDAAKAVVVLWTAESVMSDWVLYEADRAHKANKLVPVRNGNLSVERIPPPYAAVLNIITIGDQLALWRALEHLGVKTSPIRAA
jgi:hypothetical protein